ncbi:hypothetical protein ACLOJK_019274 [Asimina triloba]
MLSFGDLTSESDRNLMDGTDLPRRKGHASLSTQPHVTPDGRRGEVVQGKDQWQAAEADRLRRDRLPASAAHSHNSASPFAASFPPYKYRFPSQPSFLTALAHLLLRHHRRALTLLPAAMVAVSATSVRPCSSLQLNRRPGQVRDLKRIPLSRIPSALALSHAFSLPFFRMCTRFGAPGEEITSFLVVFSRSRKVIRVEKVFSSAVFHSPFLGFLTPS